MTRQHFSNLPKPKDRSITADEAIALTLAYAEKQDETRRKEIAEAEEVFYLDICQKIQHAATYGASEICILESLIGFPSLNIRNRLTGDPGRPKSCTKKYFTITQVVYNENQEDPYWLISWEQPKTKTGVNK